MDHDTFLEALRIDLREAVSSFMPQLMRDALDDRLGRRRYERTERPSNHRNGSYPRRFTIKGVGEVALVVPRDRDGSFQSQVVPRFRRYERSLVDDLSLMFLSGCSSRSLAMISRRLPNPGP